MPHGHFQDGGEDQPDDDGRRLEVELPKEVPHEPHDRHDPDLEGAAVDGVDAEDAEDDDQRIQDAMGDPQEVHEHPDHLSGG